MMALTDDQKTILATVAQTVPLEKRALLLERTEALMKFRPRSDESFREVVTLACAGLVQQFDGFVIPE
jgi:hypothetical protein